MNIAPLREQFFDAEAVIGKESIAVRFVRTTRVWATWASNMAKGLGDVQQTLTATASLNFGSMAAGASDDLTVSVPRVSAADVSPVVSIGVPAGLTAGLVFHGWVSADDVVTVRATNASTGVINPGAAVFRVEVRRY